jgi:hypothetical protein
MTGVMGRCTRVHCLFTAFRLPNTRMSPFGIYAIAFESFTFDEYDVVISLLLR